VRWGWAGLAEDDRSYRGGTAEMRTLLARSACQERADIGGAAAAHHREGARDALAGCDHSIRLSRPPPRAAEAARWLCDRRSGAGSRAAWAAGSGTARGPGAGDRLAVVPGRGA
jgi:hypothetical protein